MNPRDVFTVHHRYRIGVLFVHGLSHFRQSLADWNSYYLSDLSLLLIYFLQPNCSSALINISFLSRKAYWVDFYCYRQLSDGPFFANAIRMRAASFNSSSTVSQRIFSLDDGLVSYSTDEGHRCLTTEPTIRYANDAWSALLMCSEIVHHRIWFPPWPWHVPHRIWPNRDTVPLSCKIRISEMPLLKIVLSNNTFIYCLFIFLCIYYFLSLFHLPAYDIKQSVTDSM